MRILHVSLADPWKHSGGLNQYCRDVMQAERNIGNEVFGLYAGSQISLKTSIKKIRDNEYELVGALPKALTYGVENPVKFMKNANPEIFASFLKIIMPDIIHVNSIMGLYKEFFEEAQREKIPMMFTTHDYYPLCFRCNFINDGGELCEIFHSEKCTKCNMKKGMSNVERILIDTDFYQTVKKCAIVKCIKKRLIKNKIENNERDEIKVIDDRKCMEYHALHDYYADILCMINNIHCNSELARKIYFNAVPELSYFTHPISRYGLMSFKRKQVKKNILEIAYFGGYSVAKGYFNLIEALEKLEDIGGWRCCLYGQGFESQKNINEKIIFKGYFEKKEEVSVWKDIDLVIVPSQWPETYGYVVLEALAKGIPVICSDLVGAKDLLGQLGDKCVYEHDDSKALADLIMQFLNKEFYESFIKEIGKIDLPVDMEKNTRQLVDYYKKIIKNNR